MDTLLHPCSAPAAAPALAGSARMTPAELQQRLSWLPALPQAALKALEALHDDVLDLPQCAEPLARDTALAACTLRLANSSFYGVQGRITQVQDALAILGRRTTANLVATVMVAGQFTPSEVPGFDFKAFWHHAVAAAIAAQALARRTRQDEPTAFIAGLLHDIGRLVLATLCPQAEAQALAHAQQSGITLAMAERELLGIDHAELGERVALHWRLPQAVAQAIGGHHDPGGEGGPYTLAHTVQMADALVHALDLTGIEPERAAALAAPAAAYVAAHGTQLLPVLREIETGVAAVSQALGL